jgi:hypothetical protein
MIYRVYSRPILGRVGDAPQQFAALNPAKMAGLCILTARHDVAESAIAVKVRYDPPLRVLRAAIQCPPLDPAGPLDGIAQTLLRIVVMLAALVMGTKVGSITGRRAC